MNPVTNKQNEELETLMADSQSRAANRDLLLQTAF